MRKLILAGVGMALGGFVIGTLAVSAVTEPTVDHVPKPHRTSASQPIDRTYDAPTPAVSAIPGAIGTNEGGQSYGQWGEAEGLVLVEAIATNGQIGYVYTADLAAPRMDEELTPEEAAKLQPTTRMIPVYLTDGVTQVGEFKVGGAIVGEGESDEK